ncbi:hypothetical protein [Sporolituus thermophilus]|uniref:Uncharacterized protein n=1 Tax=Sporolituus thermophilus DSM 23256 TaxID=1123285 RepID=A0A1G7K2U1_9FIRM|nr:hypothetical protein [Sporolituus thermophilus]SDF31576.1 hypothetical protein SAMN05660235_01151 [Sporolituus thermophilus DSM 23256]
MKKISKDDRYEKVKFYLYQPRDFKNEFTVYATNDPDIEKELCQILDKKIGYYEEIDRYTAIEKGLEWPIWEIENENQCFGSFKFPFPIELAEMKEMLRTDPFKAVELAIEGTTFFVRKERKRKMREMYQEMHEQ